MALQILASIGTDRGITKEAYIRIADYQISKQGSANFRTELFMNKEDSKAAQGLPFFGQNQARNIEIGESISVSLLKEVKEVVTTKTTQTNGDGVQTEVETKSEISKLVPDLSSAEGVDVFVFGYTHLKEKLVKLFGQENVVDC